MTDANNIDDIASTENVIYLPSVTESLQVDGRLLKGLPRSTMGYPIQFKQRHTMERTLGDVRSI